MGDAQRNPNAILGSAESICDDLRKVRSAGGFANALGQDRLEGVLAFRRGQTPGVTVEQVRAELRQFLEDYLAEREATILTEGLKLERLAVVAWLRQVMFNPYGKPLGGYTDLRNDHAVKYGRDADYMRRAEDRLFFAVAASFIEQHLLSALDGQTVTLPESAEDASPVAWPGAANASLSALEEAHESLRHQLLDVGLFVSMFASAVDPPPQAGRWRRKSRQALHEYSDRHVRRRLWTLATMSSASLALEQALEAQTPRTARFLRLATIQASGEVANVLDDRPLATLVACQARSHGSEEIFERELRSLPTGEALWEVCLRGVVADIEKRASGTFHPPKFGASLRALLELFNRAQMSSTLSDVEEALTRVDESISIEEQIDKAMREVYG